MQPGISAVFWACALAVSGCAPGAHPSVSAPPPSSAGLAASKAPATAAPSNASVPQDAAAGKGEPQLRHGIAWYVDEPEAAFAEARRRRQLVFVDLWAAWCHTCLSMQEYVLTRAKLGSSVDRFVFLAVDTDREQNAAFLETAPVGVWPTLYVLSPDDRRVEARWLGAASAGQVSRFLADAERAHEVRTRSPSPAGDAYALLARAAEHAARREFEAAARAYRGALEAGGAGWPRTADTLVQLASALDKADNPAGCADLFLAREPPARGDAISRADYAAVALACASELEESDPRARKVAAEAARRLAVLCERGDAELTPDDRADACGTLGRARKALGDAPGARAATAVQLRVIEQAAAGLPDDVAVMYDFARSDALAELGRAEEALALLARREQALPDNLNPPHHRARILKRLGRWDEGLAAVERALALAYGPRRATLMSLKVELLAGAGRREQALAAAEEQLETLRALPVGQKRPEAERAAERRRESLRAP